MTTFDERLMSSLKVFERWRPALEASFSRITSGKETPDGLQHRPHSSFTRTAETGDTQFAEPIPLVDQPWPPTLETLLAQAPDMPPYSILMGACDDGLPFVLNLANPAPGALLIIADTGAGKTRLLHSLAASVGSLNSPEQVHYSIIAHDPGEYLDLAGDENCQEIFACDEEAAGSLILELTMLAEARQRNRQLDPAVVLLIDDLAGCITALDEETYLRLYWLARHGPRSRIWIIAALPTARSGEVDPRFLSAFRTRVMGFISDNRLATELSGDRKLSTASIGDTGQFLLPYGDGWLPVWVCESSVPGEED